MVAHLAVEKRGKALLSSKMVVRMFGLFGSKKKKKSWEEVCKDIAAELFIQIEQARDEAKEGGIIEEKVFNDRLNSMFAAGYLLGYVDSYVQELAEEEEARKRCAQTIFETMFPGSGMDFVKEKLAARRAVTDLDEDHPQYAAIAAGCNSFDVAMAAAAEEVDNNKKNTGSPPGRLKAFLLLGEG